MLDIESKVVIVDESVSDYLATFIPDNCSSIVIPLRSSERFWNWKIIFFFLLQMPFLLARRINLRGSYVLSVCRSVDCRVILSFIDNNNWDRGLVETGLLRIVLFQNGSRTAAEYARKRYDILFGYPRRQPEKVDAVEYYGVGNIKMNFAVRGHGLGRCDRKTILFVSQYRPHSTPYSSMCACQIKLAKWSAEFACATGYQFAVALNGKMDDWLFEERQIFDQALQIPVTYCDRSESLLASYKMILDSTLVVGHSSSILVESIALGRPVIIGWNVCYREEFDTLIDYFGQPEMSAFTLSEKADYFEFKDKANFLIGMPENNLLMEVDGIRESYCELRPDGDIESSVKTKLLEISGTAPGSLKR